MQASRRGLATRSCCSRSWSPGHVHQQRLPDAIAGADIPPWCSGARWSHSRSTAARTRARRLDTVPGPADRSSRRIITTRDLAPAFSPTERQATDPTSSPAVDLIADARLRVESALAGQRVTEQAAGRLSSAAGCAEPTIRRSPAVTTTRSARLSLPWLTTRPVSSRRTPAFEIASTRRSNPGLLLPCSSRGARCVCGAAGSGHPRERGQALDRSAAADALPLKQRCCTSTPTSSCTDSRTAPAMQRSRARRRDEWSSSFPAADVSQTPASTACCSCRKAGPST